MYGVGFFRSSFLGLGVGEYMGRYIMEGLIAFWTGLIIAQFIMPKLLSRKRRRWRHSWDTARLYKILWLTFYGCLFVFLFSLRRTGWLLAQPNLEVTRTQTIDQIGGYAFYVIRSMALVLYLGFIFMFIHKPRRWRTKGMLLAIMIIGSLVLLGTGYRNGVVVAIIGAMAIYNYAVRPIGVKALLLVALALLLGTAGYGLWRAGQPEIFSLSGILDRAWHEIARPLHTMQRIVENVPWLVPH
jgi:hypothetical protein